MTGVNMQTIKAMQTLIRLVAAGACQSDVSDLDVDWQAVLPLAAEQNVISLVACALLHSPGLECPQDLREHVLDVMRIESSQNFIRRQRMLHLLKEMQETGIEAKIIKGYAVAECYAHPECRGAVDTDLLVEVQQEKQAIDFLEKKNFKISIRGATSHHSVCQHKKYGVLELHVALYAELIRDIWFGEINAAKLIQEQGVEVNADCGSFTTLGLTDHLIYLTLHMVKHFILEGLTLRMMLDLALFFSKHRETIDIKRYWSVMETLNYSALVNCVLWSMVTYGGFGSVDFPGMTLNAPEQVVMVLSDLASGGYMGIREKEDRHKSGMEYNRQMLLREKSQLQYTLFMVNWKLRSGLNAMFPPLRELRKKYPCTEKHVLLIPLVWVYHVIAFPIKNRRKLAPGRDIQWDNCLENDVVDKRMDLFKALGMLR